MKKINPIWLPVAVAAMVGLFLLWQNRRRNKLYKPRQSSNTTQPELKQEFNADDGKAAILAVKAKHGPEMAEVVERIFRWETAHFTSGQYRKTATPGMEAHGPAPTYGWYVPFFLSNINYMPVGTHTMTENGTGKQKTFVVLPTTTAAAMFLADYINRYNGNWARWYSTKANEQADYRAKVNSVTPRFARGIA